ncbi:unnamed protein product [Schistosoma guineensis]|nr:unnamed protein product [Schistosoma guineensis]
MCSSFQSVDTCSSSPVLLKRMWSIFAVTPTSAFSTSAEMSGPTALPLLICLSELNYLPKYICYFVNSPFFCFHGTRTDQSFSREQNKTWHKCTSVQVSTRQISIATSN